jgi:hypothetical protein
MIDSQIKGSSTAYKILNENISKRIQEVNNTIDFCIKNIQSNNEI